MSISQNSFQSLCQHVQNTACLQSTLALLEWDQQTKLPSQGGAYRSRQITFLAGEIHRRQTDPKLIEMLEELSQSDAMNDTHGDFATTVREIKRDCEKKQKLPETLVQALAEATSTGQQVWVNARKENDFAQFAPHLEKIFELKRQQADAVGHGGDRYDALLDDYEPASSTEQVRNVLDELRKDLVPLVSEIAEAKKRPNSKLVHSSFPVAEQRTLGVEASKQIGFDFERGRIDVTHHPFCTELGPDDVRITTRYDDSFFNMSFFGTLHEAGHGIYEQGLRGDQYGLPTGKYCSLGIHESQSRLWENLVGRSRGFWSYFYGQTQSLFSSALADVSENDFYEAINVVEPSLIRVEADEATYNLHIIIRFELEIALLNQEITIAELPQAWNDKYREFLGISPPDDANGVMQDVHWSAGLVGYFPTYSLGNIFASQLFDAAEKELGELQPMFSRGEFAPLKNWLNAHVHQFGQSYKPMELMKKVTGQELDHQYLISHLRTKLAPIYGL